MMSEPYFPWRDSHQLHCSRKPWSVLWATKKSCPKCPPHTLCTRISAECSTPASGTRLRCTNTQISNITHGASVHHISLEPEPFLLCCDTVCFFLSFIFSIRRRVSVMKGSVLIQDEEIMCWPPEDYKTMLLLMS